MFFLYFLDGMFFCYSYDMCYEFIDSYDFIVFWFVYRYFMYLRFIGWGWGVFNIKGLIIFVFVVVIV